MGDTEKKGKQDVLLQDNVSCDASIIARKQQILDELEKKTLDQCNVAFFFMGGLPIIFFIYLVGVKMFSWNVMVGYIGDMLLVAFLSSIVGLVLSRTKLKTMINLIVSYNKLLLEKEKEIYSLKHQVSGMQS